VCLSVACQNGRFVDRSVEVKQLVSPHDVSEKRPPFNPTGKNHVTPRPSTEIRVVFGKGLTLHGSSPSPYIRPIAVLVKLLLVSANYYWCQQTTLGVSKLLLVSANYYWCQQILPCSYMCTSITISTNADKCRHHITTPLTLYVKATCFNP
jgi:hypothetical protein